MARVDDIQSLIPEQLYVGLSQLYGVTVLPSQSVITIKIAAGGSLEIFGGTFATLNGASVAFGWGKGYLMGATEVFSFNATGNFYLAATGATVTASLIRGIGPT